MLNGAMRRLDVSSSSGESWRAFGAFGTESFEICIGVTLAGRSGAGRGGRSDGEVSEVRLLGPLVRLGLGRLPQSGALLGQPAGEPTEPAWSLRELENSPVEFARVRTKRRNYNTFPYAVMSFYPNPG